ncbi:uncharacterized protein, partial [Miscanthus floridulus]|uniref:uncharacterized protein n=1 Tax=Miscanthus floridulus TaxID=154761 RepID=UPI0034596A0D
KRPYRSSSQAGPRAAHPPQAAGAARTIASIVLDSAESSFTASCARQDCCSDSLSTASEASALAAACDDAAEDAIVVRGIRSDRLLFDPGASATNSILEEKSAAAASASAGPRHLDLRSPWRREGHPPSALAPPVIGAVLGWRHFLAGGSSSSTLWSRPSPQPLLHSESVGVLDFFVVYLDLD